MSDWSPLTMNVSHMPLGRFSAA